MSSIENEQNILIFRSAGRLFSLPASMVEEIAKPGVVTPLPFLESYVDGLVSLNGIVAVQINFSGFIGHVSNNNSETYDLLQINNDTGTYALKVDEVIENIYINATDIRSFQVEQDSDSEQEMDQHKSIVEGEFDWNGLTVLHIASNPLNEVLNVVNVPSTQRAVLPKLKQEQKRLEDTHRFLIMALENEHFAFHLEDVLEIYEAQSITAVPGSVEQVLGISLIREQPVLVLSSKKLLGMQELESPEESKVFLLLFRFNESRLALAFDQVVGIEDIASKQLKLNGQNKHTGVLLSQNQNLINLLKLETLVSERLAKDISVNLPQNQESDQAQYSQTGKFLQVKYHNEKYIFPCDDVTCIMEYSTPDAFDESLQTHSRESIKGVTHFEGQVLPVLELNRNNNKTLNCSAYVVLKGEQNEFAVPVLDAERIIELELNHINYYDAEDARIISGLAKCEGELLSLVDVSYLESMYFGEARYD